MQSSAWFEVWARKAGGTAWRNPVQCKDVEAVRVEFRDQLQRGNDAHVRLNHGNGVDVVLFSSSEHGQPFEAFEEAAPLLGRAIDLQRGYQATERELYALANRRRMAKLG